MMPSPALDASRLGSSMRLLLSKPSSSLPHRRLSTVTPKLQPPPIKCEKGRSVDRARLTYNLWSVFAIGITSILAADGSFIWMKECPQWENRPSQGRLHDQLPSIHIDTRNWRPFPQPDLWSHCFHHTCYLMPNTQHDSW